MSYSKQKAFTLIEMLIVIVIIGILAAALIPRLVSVQGRARDAKRKVDFKQIQDALYVYKIDNSTYPPAGGNYGNYYVYSNATQPRIVQLSGVMTSIPLDPNNGVIAPWNTGGNSYAYGNVYTPGDTFTLLGALENVNDNDRCVVKNTKNRAGAMYVGCNFSQPNDNLLYLVSDIGSH